MPQKLVLLLVIFISNQLYAQPEAADSLPYKYVNQTIYRYGGSFLKGNEKFRFADLSREFSMSDFGLDFYTKAKKQRTTGTILRYLSVFSGLAAVGVAANNGRRNLAYGLFGGQMVFLLGSMRYSNMSAQSLDRALWQRNKDVLFPPR